MSPSWSGSSQDILRSWQASLLLTPRVKLPICFPIALTHSLRKARFRPKRPITPRQFQDDHGSIAVLTWKQGLGSWRKRPLIAPGPVGADITVKPQPAAMESFRTPSVMVATLPLQKVSVMLVRALPGFNFSLHLGTAALVSTSAAQSSSFTARDTQLDVGLTSCWLLERSVACVCLSKGLPGSWFSSPHMIFWTQPYPPLLGKGYYSHGHNGFGPLSRNLGPLLL